MNLPIRIPSMSKENEEKRKRIERAAAIRAIGAAIESVHPEDVTKTYLRSIITSAIRSI